MAQLVAFAGDGDQLGVVIWIKGVRIDVPERSRVEVGDDGTVRVELPEVDKAATDPNREAALWFFGGT